MCVPAYVVTSRDYDRCKMVKIHYDQHFKGSTKLSRFPFLISFTMCVLESQSLYDWQVQIQTFDRKSFPTLFDN